MLRGKLIDLRLFRESDLDEFVKLWQDVSARGEFYPAGLTTAVARRQEFLETGYWKDNLGRMAIVELMAMDSVLRDLVARKAPADQIRSEALERGMQTLKDSGLTKAMRGETTLEEVLRVCLAEE